MIEFKGKCKGIRLEERGINDSHISFTILTEDDENWFSSESASSSYWIDDLIQQLQRAKEFIETQELDIYQGKAYGYKFKK